MLNFIRTTVSQFFGELGAKLTSEYLRGGAAGGATIVAEEIRRRTREVPRDVVVQILQSMRPEDCDRLMRLHLAYLTEGDDTAFMTMMAASLPRDASDRIDREAAKACFAYLNRTWTYDQLVQHVEMVKHDPIQGMFRVFASKAGAPLALLSGVAARVAVRAGEGVVAAAKRLDAAAEAAAPKLGPIKTRLEEALERLKQKGR